MNRCCSLEKVAALGVANAGLRWPSPLRQERFAGRHLFRNQSGECAL